MAEMIYKYRNGTDDARYIIKSEDSTVSNLNEHISQTSRTNAMTSTKQMVDTTQNEMFIPKYITTGTK